MVRTLFDAGLLACQGAMFRYAMKLCQFNAAAARDLVQETNLRALEKSDHYQDQGGRMVSWLLTLMHNEHCNMVRRYKRSRRVFHIFDDDFKPDAVCLGARPDEKLFAREVVAEIERMPAQFSEPLKLMVMGDSYEEIVAKSTVPPQRVTGNTRVPVGTVRSRLSRGRAILRKELA